MESLRALMQRAVEDRVFPGGVLLVAKEGNVLFSEAFGLARIDPEQAMTAHTVFDLASLTKPLATSLALMRLIHEGRLSLDQTLGRAIQAFSGTDKASITIRRLLSHTSGFPDYRPYFETLAKHAPSERRDLLRAGLVQERLVGGPGRASLYSDLDFMVLEWLVEVIAQKGLNDFVKEAVYDPLGISDLFFIPIRENQGGRQCQCAATEDCPWRGKVLQGEVHDDNAWVMGGVAGHAGLFGTAEAVFGLLQELLNVHSGKPNKGLFPKDLVYTFFKRDSDAGTWALGFDTPTRPDSSSGRYFSDQSVGHLGFTGTSFWMDLVKEVVGLADQPGPPQPGQRENQGFPARPSRPRHGSRPPSIKRVFSRRPDFAGSYVPTGLGRRVIDKSYGGHASSLSALQTFCRSEENRLHA